MNMEKFLSFFIKHNALLIEAMIALILITSGFLAYRSFRSSRDEEAGGTVPDMSNLEDTLKKILEKANQIPVQSSSGIVSGGTLGVQEGGANNPEVATLVNEIAKLKQELEKKQAEIEAMKKSPVGASAADGGLSTEEKAALNNQINELKRKLEEYDIISADIADLSFYKEENARLQKELAAKGAGSVSAPTSSAQSASATAASAAIPQAPITTTPPPPVEPQPPSSTTPPAQSQDSTVVSGSPESVTPDVMVAASPASAPEASISVTGQAPPTAQPEHAVENVIDDDIMKDFAAAVADQGGTDLSEIEIPQIDPITAESIEGTKQTIPVEAPTMPNIDIPAIGEEKTEEKAETKSSEGDGASPLGSLDLDKMASEVVALPDASQVEGNVDSLSGEMDPEKLAQEASTLTEQKVKPEDKELMGKFEDFVKKEKT